MRRAVVIVVLLVAFALAWLLARDDRPPASSPVERSSVAATSTSSNAGAKKIVNPPKIELVAVETATQSAAKLDAAPGIDASSFQSAFCDPPGERKTKVRLSDEAAANKEVRKLFSDANDAHKAGEHERERELLKKARALAPNDPAIAWLYAFELADTHDFAAAAEGIEVYLRWRPSDESAVRRLRRLRTQEDVQRDFHRITFHGITLSFPPDAIATSDARVVLAQIDDALDESARLTGTTRRRELYAVLYRDQSELLAVTCAPSWTGAVYDGTLRVVLDKTKVHEADVRHESLHAQLSPLIGNSPRWFHEGLAQYVGDRRALRWRKMHELMVKNQTYAPFTALEGSFWEIAENDDAALVYAQSAAMISLLVEQHGEAAIARAVTLLRGGIDGSKLAGELGLREEDLLDLLSRRRVVRD